MAVCLIATGPLAAKELAKQKSSDIDPLGRADMAIAQLRGASASCRFARMDAQVSFQLRKMDEYTAASAKVPEEKDKLEKAGIVAIKEAKSKPDLVKAVKEYYLAAAAFCGAEIPANRLQELEVKQLESAQSAKEDALKLEMKLAGMGAN